MINLKNNQKLIDGSNKKTKQKQVCDDEIHVVSIYIVFQ